MIQFRILGTPVRVQPFFLLIAVFLGWGQVQDDPAWLEKMAIWIVVMFTGVLAHELGHARAGRAFGLSPRVELHGMGGLTSWESGRLLSPGRSIVVTGAGPLVGIVVGGLTAVVWALVGPAEGGLVEFLLESVVWVNLGWGVLNLVPMMPLDGGNLMASVFELVASSKGRVAARWLSLFLAAGLLAVAFAYQQVYLAVIVAYLGFINYRGLQIERRLGADLPIVGELRDLQRLVDEGRLAQAREQARSLGERAQTPALRVEAMHIEAWTHVLDGDAGGARTVLARLGDAPVDPALAGAVRLVSGDPEGAIPYLEEAVRGGSSIAAEPLARALVELGRYGKAADVFGARGAAAVPVELLEQVEESAHRDRAYREAARIGELLFERDRQPLRAFNVACSLSLAGDLDDAMRWLERARDAGMRRPDLLDSDEDLAALRVQPGWAALRATFE